MHTYMRLLLQSSYEVELRPATWYVMVVTAHNDAGSTESKLKFSTLTYTGSTSHLSTYDHIT